MLSDSLLACHEFQPDDGLIAQICSEAAAQWGFKVKCLDPRQFAIVLGNERMVLVAFRGTDPKSRVDWWTNINVGSCKSPIGRAHCGFIWATEAFFPELPEKIRIMSERQQSVWITGHSLGGAIALLASIKLMIENGIRVSGLYTFGQPRVGSLSFCKECAAKLPDRHFRFVNHVDGVSDVPIFLREHAGEVRYFDTNGTMHVGEPKWRVQLCDHVRAPALLGGLSIFAAHGAAHYVTQIDNEIGRLKS